MYHILIDVAIITFLLSMVECRPAEVAEPPLSKSPINVISEAKDGFGFNVIQKRLINALHPKPIVDTITEEEKYGNTVEHNLGKKVVKAVERVSNLVNSAVRVPDEAVKSGSRKLTDFLDNIGGKIVGLQK